MLLTLNQAIAAHLGGRLKEAEQLYRSILEKQPTTLNVYNNLGVVLHELGRFDEAEAIYRKAIELKPDYAEAHNSLGSTLKQLKRFNEAEVSYKKAIDLKPDYAKAYNNLGITQYELKRFNEAEVSYKKAIDLKPDYVKAHNNYGVLMHELGRFDEAEAIYRKAIELKPDYAEAHNSLGSTLKQLSRVDEAEISFTKAIKFKPDYVEAHNNLDALVKEKDLLVKIFEIRRSMKKNKVNSIDSNLGLTSNPFITYRSVEKKFLKDLYKCKLEELDKTHKRDARFGNGMCSDFNFFKHDSLVVNNIEADLTNIMKEAVKSDIYIFDSFLNIYEAGSGTAPHNHVGSFDKIQGLVNQKYSLTYYLSVGDQNCSEPGNFQLYSPSEEIKVTEGMVVIFPAIRNHYAVYNGMKDRIMVGVNFYSLL